MTSNLQALNPLSTLQFSPAFSIFLPTDFGVISSCCCRAWAVRMDFGISPGLESYEVTELRLSLVDPAWLSRSDMDAFRASAAPTRVFLARSRGEDRKGSKRLRGLMHRGG